MTFNYSEIENGLTFPNCSINGSIDLEKEQLSKFYQVDYPGSRSSGFIQDRFDIDPIAWGQHGQGMCYPSWRPDPKSQQTHFESSVIPISLSLLPSSTYPEKSQRSFLAEAKKGDVTDEMLSERHQFVSTYNHDYWEKPRLCSTLNGDRRPKSSWGEENVSHTESLGGFGKVNKFKLGDDWHWNWSSFNLSSDSMYLTNTINLSGSNGQSHMDDGTLRVPVWKKFVGSNRTDYFNPYERDDGPLEPIKYNAFPILMKGHQNMLHVNNPPGGNINPKSHPTSYYPNKYKAGQRRNFTK